MAHQSTKSKREQNRIEIDMNEGQFTDRNLNVRQLRNKVMPLMLSQVTSHLRNLNSNIPQQSSFNWSSPPQRPRVQSENHNSAEKLRSTPMTKASKGIKKINKLHPLPQSVRVLR